METPSLTCSNTYKYKNVYVKYELLECEVIVHSKITFKYSWNTVSILIGLHAVTTLLED